MIYISYENSNHFIHKINYNILNDLINVKKIGFLENNCQIYNELDIDDFIIFAIDINEKSNLFAYTKIDNVLFDNEELYGVYNSNKKLLFNKLKFFKQPRIYENLSINDFEYLKIDKSDYKSIIPSKDKLDKKLPIIIKYHPNLTVLEFIQNTNNFVEEMLPSEVKNSNEDKNNISLSFEEDSRFFIQCIDFNDLNILKEKMYLNEVENKSQEIKQVKPNDYILLCISINSKIYFFAIGKVAYNLFNSFENFKYFKPPNTIKFRKINYVSNVNEVKDLKFNPDTQYFEINKKEAYNICGSIEFSNDFPNYFGKYDFGDVRNFIVKTGKTLFNLINENYDEKIYPIKEFLKLLCEFLNYYDFNISYDELEEFFSSYAPKFGFKLTSTREHDLIVELNIKGRKKEVTYIMMK